MLRIAGKELRFAKQVFCIDEQVSRIVEQVFRIAEQVFRIAEQALRLAWNWSTEVYFPRPIGNDRPKDRPTTRADRVTGSS